MPISANNMSASPTALILIADGTEEMELYAADCDLHCVIQKC